MMSVIARKTPGQWMRRGFHGGLALACWLAFRALPAAAAPQFEASLDHDTIRLGETATLSMTFSEKSPEFQPNVPQIDGIRFGAMSYIVQASTDFNQSSSSTVFTLELSPTRAGEFTIPPIVSVVDGVRL